MKSFMEKFGYTFLAGLLIYIISKYDVENAIASNWMGIIQWFIYLLNFGAIGYNIYLLTQFKQNTRPILIVAPILAIFFLVEVTIIIEQHKYIKKNYIPIEKLDTISKAIEDQQKFNKKLLNQVNENVLLQNEINRETTNALNTLIQHPKEKK